MKRKRKDLTNHDHPTTQALEGQWHKVLAAVMLKYDLEKIVLTPADLSALSKQLEGRDISARELPDGLHLAFVTDEEAKRLIEGEIRIKKGIGDS